MPQPTQRFGSKSSAATFISPLNWGREIRRTQGPQSFTQIWHALHVFLSITGFGHAGRRTGVQSFPVLSTTALFMQTRPQTPQFTQRASLIECILSLSPLIAETGQFIAQAVQPVQASVM